MREQMEVFYDIEDGFILLLSPGHEIWLKFVPEAGEWFARDVFPLEGNAAIRERFE